MTTEAMRVGEAVYYDGRSNRKHRVVLNQATGLDIVEDGAVIATWPYADVRRADGPPHLLRVSCLWALPLARLEIEDAAAQVAVSDLCPSLDADRGGHQQTLRIVAWSLAAAASIVGLIYFGIPFAADRL